MKRAIVMLACVLAIGMANAQESNAKKYELGCNIGTTTFTNYSTLSLFQDDHESYTTMSEAIHFGIRKNNVLFGLQLQYAMINTSATTPINETATWFNISPMTRAYYNVGGQWEIFLGMKLGFGIMQNFYKDAGDDYSHTRFGVNLEFETGIQYRFSSGDYLGLRAAFIPIGSESGKEINPPTGLTANDRNMLNGYSLMLQYGLCF